MCDVLSIFDTNSIIGDAVLSWKPYKNGDDIVSKFSPEEWHKIAFDIDSEEQLQNLFDSYPYRIRGFVLYENATANPVGFVYVLKERKALNTVSIHGGGWNNTMTSTLFHYRGMMLMIEAVLSQGVKVRTACLVTNERAYRFLRSIGFVKYRTTADVIKMWINEKRLHNSKIYHHFYKK